MSYQVPDVFTRGKAFYQALNRCFNYITGKMNTDFVFQSNAKSTNTPSSVVLRDTNGDFAAGKITATKVVANLAESATGVYLWRPSTAYSVGHIIHSNTYSLDNGFKRMECVIAGTSGSSEPTWGNSGDLVVDGGVTWRVNDVRASYKANIDGLVIGPTTNTTIPIVANSVPVYNASGQPYTYNNLNTTIIATQPGINGLDTGSLSTSTWYSVWVIYNPSTNTAAGLISASASAPTLPSGYTYKARVGWVKTDGTANKYLMRTLQVDDKTVYVITAGTNTAGIPILASGIAGNTDTPTLVSVAWATLAPSTAASLLVGAHTTGSSNDCIVNPNANCGGKNTASNLPAIIIVNSFAGIAWREIVPESANLYWAGMGSGSSVLIAGWTEKLSDAV